MMVITLTCILVTFIDSLIERGKGALEERTGGKFYPREEPHLLFLTYEPIT